MNDAFDLAIVGGGPAGMSAAVVASELGLRCVVFEEANVLGGRIFAGIEARAAADSVASRDQRRAMQLIGRTRTSGTVVKTESFVWNVDSVTAGGFDLYAAGTTGRVHARRVLLAGGAVERPFMFPGWTLPGVLAAGGAQILAKRDGIVPAEPVVLAGSGPLLLQLATQLLAENVPVRAILDTTPRSQLLRAARRLPGALAAGPLTWRGLGLMWRILSSHVPITRDVQALRARGTKRLSAVKFEVAGRTAEIETTLMLVHQGIVPDTQATRLLRCRHVWDPALVAWRPVADSFGNTSVDGVAVAGDATATAGAAAAETAGALAGVEAAHRLGFIATARRDELSRPLFARMRRHHTERRFIETLFEPRRELRELDDDVLVCRCEDVSAAMVRDRVRSGLRDVNAVKAVTRCGMGPCQGRTCCTALTELVARSSGRSEEDVGHLTIRPPLKPQRLSEMTAIVPGEDPTEAGFAPPNISRDR